MGPLRLLQVAIGLLLLPLVLGAVAFLGVSTLTATSNPQAAGGLATGAAIMMGVLFMAGLGLGSLVGLLALVWGGLSGQLPSMAGWVLGFFLVMAFYGAVVGVLSNGP